jgi:hypothetical protein
VNRTAIGNANYNHAIYTYNRVEGSDFTLFGYTWGNPMRAADLTRLTIMDGHLTPYRGQATGGIGWRGYDEPTCADAYAAGEPVGTCGITVRDYYFDFDESAAPWAGAGPEWDVTNGRAVWNDEGASVFVESHNGYFTARYEDIKIDGLELYWESSSPSSGGSALANTGALDKSYFRDIEFGYDGNGGEPNFEGLISLSKGGSTGEVVEYVLDRIGIQDPIDVLWPYRVNNNATPPSDYHVRYFLRDVHVDQKGATYQIVRNDYDLTSPGGEAAGGYEFYWTGGAFEMGSRYGNYERQSYRQLINTHRFDNVTDSVTGNTSEASGTYTCQSGDGTTPRFQLTNLMHIPHPTRGEVAITGGNFSGSLVSWVDDEGDGTTYDDNDDPREPFVRVTLDSPCAPGQTIEWSAAVARWLDANGDLVLFPSEANGGWYPYE